MTQKLTLALVSFVAVASLAACGLMWSFARDFQSVAADAQAASAKLLSQGQEANAELLKQNQEMMQQLSALANRDANSKTYLDWIPLRVQVVKADPKRSPAEDFSVRVRGKALTESEEISLDERTTDEGIADFGVVRPGYYYLSVSTPWGETQSRTFWLKSCAPHVEKIESPAAPPQEIKAKPIVNWPKELEGKDLAVLVSVSRGDFTKIGEEYWRGGSEMHLLVRPDGRYAAYPSVYFNQESRSGDYNSFGSLPNVNREGSLGKETVMFPASSRVASDSFPWQGSEAVLSNLKLVKLPSEAEFPGERETLTCIAPTSNVESLLRITGYSSARNSNSPEVLAKYKAIGDGVQEWRIEIPENTIALTKAVLAAADFPQYPEIYATTGVWMFNAMDKDGNQELSQEEYKPTRSLEGLITEFPVKLDAYIKAYIESRESRPSRSFCATDLTSEAGGSLRSQQNAKSLENLATL